MVDWLVWYSGLLWWVVQVYCFFDGESCVCIELLQLCSVVVIVCMLDYFDFKLLLLMMVVVIVCELGVLCVGLVVFYFVYMCQDMCFYEGEVVLVWVFGQLFGSVFNWLIMVDFYLYCYCCFGDVYLLDGYVGYVVQCLVCWIVQEVLQLLLIGLDGESVQWVNVVVWMFDVFCVVVVKQCYGDCDVCVILFVFDCYVGYMLVVLDDIIVSGYIMIVIV